MATNVFAPSLMSKVSANKSMMIGSAVVLAGAFAAMVTSAYTADHIQKSSCDRKKDAKLENAYKWSWSTAVICGLISAGTAGSMAYVVLK